MSINQYVAKTTGSALFNRRPTPTSHRVTTKNSEACVQFHSSHAGKTIKSGGITKGGRTKKAPKQFLPALKIRERHKRAYEHAKKGAEQIYRPDSVHREYRWAIIPLGWLLLTNSSHLPACTDGPPVWPQRPCACLFGVAPDRGYRVSPCYVVPCNTQGTPHGFTVSVRAETRPRNRLVSVALFLGYYNRRSGYRYRTAVSRYPALWSPDLPR